MNDALITFIYVEDLDQSDAFYGEMLGLQLVLEQAHCRIYRVSESGFVGVCRSADRPTTPEGVIITLVRDDVDTYCATLEARGARFEKRPSPNPQFSIYHAFLRDPDGHLIEIQRFDDPRWATPP
jgi:catechol 2,3-dioxygenase-like lactoylglutathione lyase family enzyme